MAKKTKSQFNNTAYQRYASAKLLCDGDNYGTVFQSMLQHDKFKGLSLNAQRLYIICRVQAQTNENSRILYNLKRDSTFNGKENPSDYGQKFVLPAKHQKDYGLNYKNTTRYFKELIDAGFIKLIENNAHRRIANVYAFSHEWLTKSKDAEDKNRAPKSTE